MNEAEKYEFEVLNEYESNIQKAIKWGNTDTQLLVQKKFLFYPRFLCKLNSTLGTMTPSVDCQSICGLPERPVLVNSFSFWDICL